MVKKTKKIVIPNIKDFTTPKMILQIVGDSEKYTITVNPYDSILQILYKISQSHHSDHHYTETSLFFRDIEMTHGTLLIDYFPYWNNNKTSPIYNVYRRKSIDIAKKYKQPPFASIPKPIVPFTPNEIILNHVEYTRSEIRQNKHKLLICSYLLFLTITTALLVLISHKYLLRNI
jgi:hypothetical protein